MADLINNDLSDFLDSTERVLVDARLLSNVFGNKFSIHAPDVGPNLSLHKIVGRGIIVSQPKEMK